MDIDESYGAPKPWTEEREDNLRKEIVEWVGKYHKGNPTIDKESMVQSIQVDMDLPNFHPTMEAIYDLPDGKVFKGYEALVKFFEDLGYDGFPEPDMPDYLHPDSDVPDISNEERADNSNYFKETNGENPELDEPMDQLSELFKGQSENQTDNNFIDIEQDGGKDSIKEDELIEPVFNEEQLAEFSKMADDVQNGNDSTNDFSQSKKEFEIDNDNNIPVSDDDFSVDFEDVQVDKVNKPVDGEIDKLNEEHKKEMEDAHKKEIAAAQMREMEEAQRQSQMSQQRAQMPPQYAQPGGISVDFGMNTFFHLMADLIKSPFNAAASTGKWAYDKHMERKVGKGDLSDQSSSDAPLQSQPMDQVVDPSTSHKLAVFADAKVAQIDRAKTKLVENLDLMSSGLNKSGSPASEEEKISLQKDISRNIKDYGNRLSEGAEQLSNKDLDVGSKKNLVDSIKESNEVLKKIDKDNSPAAKELKEKTKQLLQVITNILKALFGKKKENDAAPAM